jgi:hypothetical protein
MSRCQHLQLLNRFIEIPRLPQLHSYIELYLIRI